MFLCKLNHWDLRELLCYIIQDSGHENWRKAGYSRFRSIQLFLYFIFVFNFDNCCINNRSTKRGFNMQHQMHQPSWESGSRYLLSKIGLSSQKYNLIIFHWKNWQFIKICCFNNLFWWEYFLIESFILWQGPTAS